ncbi:tyrosine-type recombinase/integrase [Nonomuraea sp. NPDC049684]|uniref:tyrosine-type recombinase/integrase n=1 Tax=Nonomuraea sp. NPDC049684 TaxID=3364356 RepID=UPI003791E687
MLDSTPSLLVPCHGRTTAGNGDTKTPKSRRVLLVPKWGVQVLTELHKPRAAERLAAGEREEDTAHVFRREDGTPMNRYYIWREFRLIADVAGIGTNWCPRELRHSFVSLLSAHDVAIEEIACIVGHSSTHVTETVYRQEIRPALTRGVVVMDKIFKPQAGWSSGSRLAPKDQHRPPKPLPSSQRGRNPVGLTLTRRQTVQ